MLTARKELIRAVSGGVVEFFVGSLRLLYLASLVNVLAITSAPNKE